MEFKCLKFLALLKKAVAIIICFFQIYKPALFVNFIQNTIITRVNPPAIAGHGVLEKIKFVDLKNTEIC